MLNEIYAIWLREIRKAFADKWLVVIGFALPLFLIFAIGAGIDSFVGMDELGMSYTSFLGPGIIALWVMSSALSSGNSLIEDKQGMLKLMLLAPISRMSIFVGKMLAEILISFSVMLIIVVAYLFASGTVSTFAIMKAALFMLLLAFSFYGIGLAAASMFKRAKSYQMAFGLLTMGAVIVSGIFFPIKHLPVWMKWIALANPLSYGADGLRGSLTGSSEFGLLLDAAILLSVSVAMMFLGSYAFARSVQK
jgi:ABC-2 type transport system permease protein